VTPRRASGIGLVVAGLVVAGAGTWFLVDGSGDDSGTRDARRAAGITAALRAAREAEAPFRGLTETTVFVGDEEMRVVIADEGSEQVTGLRRRRDLGRYDGMLFAYTELTDPAFTMSTVPVALDIGFYGSDGRVVDRLRMEPCSGSDADCPLYRPRAEFRYAVETLAGELPRGGLG
jgi:uncharacterized membrane protein (UPF0127 family)